jgi:hypothetical protein
MDHPAEAMVVRADSDAALASDPFPLLVDDWHAVPEVLGAVKRAVDEGRRPAPYAAGISAGDLGQPGRCPARAHRGVDERGEPAPLGGVQPPRTAEGFEDAIRHHVSRQVNRLLTPAVMPLWHSRQDARGSALAGGRDS